MSTKGNNKWNFIIAIGLSVILLILIGIRLSTYFSNKKNAEVKIQVYEDRPLDIVFGYEDATLPIYMYSSYSCTFCTLFFTDVFPLIKSEYIDSKKVKLIMRLTVKTNSLEVQDAMKAAVCVNRYGNYQHLHNLLLANSKVVVTNEFQEMVNHFIEEDIYVAECILSGEAEDYLNKNIKDYEDLKLKGTPTFIIGNKIYTGYQDFEKFDKIITQHLNESNSPN